MTMQAHRYAIYLAPAGPFHTFGSQWLGRDAHSGLPLPPSATVEARPSHWVEAPARYGLHATLKPPFRLAEGTDAAMLDAAARAFAAGRQPFDATLDLRALRGFVAWCLADEDSGGAHAMHALADACVRDFERFRAPATAAEVARRDPARLSPRQQHMLREWGYPYVFDTFTFHITLTGMLAPAEQEAAVASLRADTGALLATPLAVDAISVFVQPEPGAGFVAARHYGFDGRTRDGAGRAYLP